MERSSGIALEEQKAQRPKVVLRYNLLPWQAETRKLMKKWPRMVVNCGVSSGKTSFGAASMMDELRQMKGGIAWWISAEDFQIKRFWSEFRPMAMRWKWRCRDAPHAYVQTPRGAELYGVTAKNLNAISAYHPQVLYCDEAAKIGDTAWNLIRIRMLKSKKTLLMSTPRPNHWAKLVQWGKEHRDGKWGQITVTTEEAGLIDREEIEALRRDLPEDLFRQELLAEIIADAGSVFRKVFACATGKEESPEKGVQYEVMYDPAKHQDFAVASVWHGLKLVKAIRWQKVDYKYQVKTVSDLAQEYNRAMIVYDRTGPGEAVGEMLDEECNTRSLMSFGIVFDNLKKTTLVNAASVAFERGEITLVDREAGEPYDTFIDELVAYERSRSRSGLTYTYSAPGGGHDDCVTNVLPRMAGRQEPQIRFIGERRGGGPSETSAVDAVEAEQRLRFST